MFAIGGLVLCAIATGALSGDGLPPTPTSQASMGWTKATEAEAGVLQIDLLGEGRFSRYNFTDLKKPYDGADGFVVGRLSWWVDDRRAFGPFVDAIPTMTSDDEFFFQRHVQFNAGIHWYPATSTSARASRYLRPVRLFLQVGRRVYYDVPEGVDLQRTDLQAGLDYYYDNLFVEDEPLATFLFTTVTFRRTNFSFDGYNAVLWSGNVKLGPRFATGAGRLVAYGVADWTLAARHPERFFENFLRLGAGARWYPKTDVAGGFRDDFVRRFHLFAECLANAAWLGHEAPATVEQWDLRFGLAFSTGGFFRDRR